MNEPYIIEPCDEEYQKFEEDQERQKKSKATIKQYRSNYRRLRLALKKPISETTEEKTINAIDTLCDNANSRSALLNIALLVRKLYEMPYDKIVKRREANKVSIDKNLKETNTYIALPSIEEFDEFLDNCYENEEYMKFVINYLIRFHYVRNKDLNFEFVTTLKQASDENRNYMVWQRKKLQMLYIRRDYKTAGKYGEKNTAITDERFIFAIKKVKDQFPLTDSDETIGYAVKEKYSFNKLGEGLLLKIIVNKYKGDINVLKKISNSRGTSLAVLLESYNITYHD